MLLPAQSTWYMLCGAGLGSRAYICAAAEPLQTVLSKLTSLIVISSDGGAGVLLRHIEPALIERLSVPLDDDTIQYLHPSSPSVLCFRSLKCLSLTHSHFVDDRFLEELVRASPLITHLDVTGCMELTEASATTVAQGLSLASIKANTDAFVSAVLLALASYRANALMEVWVDDCGPNVTPEALRAVVLNCQNLTIFSCISTVNLPGLFSEFVALTNEVAKSPDMFLQRLRVLRLSGHIHTIRDFDITGFTRLLLPALRVLVIASDKDNSMKALRGIALQAVRPEVHVTNDTTELPYMFTEITI